MIKIDGFADLTLFARSRTKFLRRTFGFEFPTTRELYESIDVRDCTLKPQINIAPIFFLEPCSNGNSVVGDAGGQAKTSPRHILWLCG